MSSVTNTNSLNSACSNAYNSWYSNALDLVDVVSVD